MHLIILGTLIGAIGFLLTVPSPLLKRVLIRGGIVLAILIVIFVMIIGDSKPNKIDCTPSYNIKPWCHH